MEVSFGLEERGANLGLERYTAAASLRLHAIEQHDEAAEAHSLSAWA